LDEEPEGGRPGVGVDRNRARPPQAAGRGAEALEALLEVRLAVRGRAGDGRQRQGREQERCTQTVRQRVTSARRIARPRPVSAAARARLTAGRARARAPHPPGLTPGGAPRRMRLLRRGVLGARARGAEMGRSRAYFEDLEVGARYGGVAYAVDREEM